MTIIAVVQHMASVTGLRLPETLFGGDRTSVELRFLAAEAAERIAQAHDWSALAREFTVAPVPGIRRYDLPADFGRWRLDATLRDDMGQALAGLATPEDVQAASRGPAAYRTWGVDGGQIVLDGDGPVHGTYQTRDVVLAADGTPKVEFTADDDRFRLDERLLRLAMIWQWKSNKGLPYEQEQASFRLALGRAIADDGPRAVTALGRPRSLRDVTPTWVNIPL